MPRTPCRRQRCLEAALHVGIPVGRARQGGYRRADTGCAREVTHDVSRGTRAVRHGASWWRGGRGHAVGCTRTRGLGPRSASLIAMRRRRLTCVIAQRHRRARVVSVSRGTRGGAWWGLCLLRPSNRRRPQFVPRSRACLALVGRCRVFCCDGTGAPGVPCSDLGRPRRRVWCGLRLDRLAVVVVAAAAGQAMCVGVPAGQTGGRGVVVGRNIVEPGSLGQGGGIGDLR